MKEQCLKHDILPAYENGTLKPLIGTVSREPDGIVKLAAFKCSEYTGRSNCGFSCRYMAEIKNGKLTDNIWREDSPQCDEDKTTG